MDYVTLHSECITDQWNRNIQGQWDYSVVWFSAKGMILKMWMTEDVTWN